MLNNKKITKKILNNYNKKITQKIQINKKKITKKIQINNNNNKKVKNIY